MLKVLQYVEGGRNIIMTVDLRQWYYIQINRNICPIREIDTDPALTETPRFCQLALVSIRFTISSSANIKHCFAFKIQSNDFSF